MSFDKFEEGELILIEACAFSSNIDSFINCYEPYFNLVIATKMNIYIKEQVSGVIYVSMTEGYHREEVFLIIDKTLTGLFNV